jgi:hypothetical protein
MILGSDERYGDRRKGAKPRADTMLLVRLDPERGVTAVMSCRATCSCRSRTTGRRRRRSTRPSTPAAPGSL